MGLFGFLFDKFVTVELDSKKAIEAVLMILEDPQIRSRFIAKMDEAIIGSQVVEKVDEDIVARVYDGIVKKLKSLKDGNSIPQKITLVK